MDKINGISAIISILKRQVTKAENKNEKSSASQREKYASGSRKVSVNELDVLIHDKIRKLNNRGEFSEKSIRIVIESILAWEFGDDILTDPEFGLLINKLVNNIEASDSLSALYLEYFSNIQKAR